MSTPPSFRGFLDESAAQRGSGHQQYSVCVALVPAAACDDLRMKLRPLLLSGQIKLHWRDESEARRRWIVERIVELGPMNVVISHLDLRAHRLERYRRKCLEALYHHLVAMDVLDLTFESRSAPQDRNDRAHLVALQAQGLYSRLRIAHARGGDEPLLWIADAVLGALNASASGEPRHFDALRSTVLIESRTPTSLTMKGERP
ncbi:MAG: hypothetical protein EPO52_10555 [Herbiconiux sp.]|nr:MAG: hypothetical protein EPO52_10555 [Herbiconiux sp.]